MADTFYLHSRPGAKRIVYLDFNGHLLSGTAWNQGYNAGNDIVAPPFDTDGNVDLGAFEALLFSMMAHVVDMLGQAKPGELWQREGGTPAQAV